MKRYPLPPKKGAKKEEKKAANVVVEPKIPDPETNDSALAKAISWTNASVIGNKFSVGTLTTAKYHEKTKVFDQMNQKARDQSALLP